MVRKNKEFINGTICICFNLMLGIKEDSEQDKTYDDSVEEDDNFDAGQVVYPLNLSIKMTIISCFHGKFYSVKFHTFLELTKGTEFYFFPGKVQPHSLTRFRASLFFFARFFDFGNFIFFPQEKFKIHSLIKKKMPRKTKTKKQQQQKKLH